MFVPRRVLTRNDGLKDIHKPGMIIDVKVYDTNNNLVKKEHSIERSVVTTYAGIVYDKVTFPLIFKGVVNFTYNNLWCLNVLEATESTTDVVFGAKRPIEIGTVTNFTIRDLPTDLLNEVEGVTLMSGNKPIAPHIPGVLEGHVHIYFQKNKIAVKLETLYALTFTIDDLTDVEMAYIELMTNDHRPYKNVVSYKEFNNFFL